MMIKKIKDFAEKLALNIINSMGSVISLIIHTIFFVFAWLFTDFLFLTTVVSLEAIYLSILIQMSVNYQSKKLQSIQEDMEEIKSKWWESIYTIFESYSEADWMLEDHMRFIPDSTKRIELFSHLSPEEKSNYRF